MAVLETLEPSRVFHYFEEICNIPHGSGNTKQISDFLVEFARAHQLKYVQDELNNVIIYKDATKGYENAPAVIIQGHMDMVAEKTPESAHDFLKDGLELMIDGDYITAKDTTLGGDDGIAVAYALAILESDVYEHPALEVVITVDEEIGLLGAAALDYSQLKGKILLNLDSEEEGHLLTGCAGGLSGIGHLPVQYTQADGCRYELQVQGLMGGHSGVEINKHRGNANILMGRFLHMLEDEVAYELSEIGGGLKDNAIPRNCRALIIAASDAKSKLEEAAAKLQHQLRQEYAGSDEGIEVCVKDLGAGSEPVLNPISKEKVIFYLLNVPNGVQKMSGLIEGLVETSLNLGILEMNQEELTARFGVRSSVGSAKDFLSERLRYITEFLGGEYDTMGEYPAWEYRQDSPFRDLMVETYQKMYQKDPIVEVIHAGLECGIFFDNIDGLDCISIGPDMCDIHTTEEKLSISSTKRVFEYILEVLKAVK